MQYTGIYGNVAGTEFYLQKNVAISLVAGFLLFACKASPHEPHYLKKVPVNIFQ